MSVEKVKEYLAEKGVASPVLEFEKSSATVELAAIAVGVEGKRIAKTLSLKGPEKALILVIAGDARIDNKKFKAQFGFKARMLSHEEAYEITGHMVGGVCPFALKSPLRVYLDVSLKRFETVFPAAGSGNSAVELSPEQMREITDASWVDVCKEEAPVQA